MHPASRDTAHRGRARTGPDPTRARLARDEGFTLVEVLVASMVLVVGMLGTLTLLTGAMRMTVVNDERVAATNLARELVEATRGLRYQDMAGTLVRERLQARGLGSGSPWTIQRRGATFTITATSCTYDNPGDKLAAIPPAHVCMPQPAGAVGDSNGDDFRRTTFAIAWREVGGAQRTVTQTTLAVNPSGGLGPRILDIAPVAQTITSTATSASVVWTTTDALTVRWVVDDGASSGSVTGSTSFATEWSIGTSGSGSEILDGAYEITAQPFDDRDVAGEAKRANIVLNRRRPYAPPSVAGGHNTRLGDWVEIEWGLNKERDVLGYRAVWAGPDAVVGNDDDRRVCPTAAEGTLLDPATTSCVDLAPPSGATKYYVVAVDRDPANELREGDRRTLQVAAAGARPHPPIGLTVQTVGGNPSLAWRPPLLGSVSFYRIYRDGTRYDRTSAGALTYTDTSPGSGSHQYWVTAVDSSFNESDVLGPVTWSR